jgi:hypothetical protein
MVECRIPLNGYLFEYEKKKKVTIARDGDRTHAHIRELDLKSNALTTRPPWLLMIIPFKNS